MKRLLFLTLMTLSPWLSAQIVVAPLETCAGDPVNLDASGLASAGVSGVNASALQFGSGDYMRIPITAALSDFQEVTIEFWYYQISRGEEFIVATEYFNTGWGFHNENPNVMQWRVEGGPYSLGGSTYPIPYNQWMHVAGVYDGSELRLYVDGNLIASEAFSGPISDSRNEDIVVNRHVWASGSSSRLSGYLDELRISGVARYSDNFAPPAFDFSSDDQTLGLWHFDSSTGLMLDDSDYGHHGTPSGTGSTGAVPYASYDTFDEPSYLWSNGMTSPTIDVAPQAQETFVVTVTQGDQVVMDSVELSPDLTCCPGPGCCLDGTVWDFDLGGCVMEEPPFVETGGAYASVNPCYFDSNDDGLVEVNDLMNLLSVYNLTCGELPEAAPWQCGDPLGYQGYDYQTVQIGDQCWFAENLRAQNYRNGDEIPSGMDGEGWSSVSEGATTVYGEYEPCEDFSPGVEACDENSALTEFGRLYNWHAVSDSRNVCPSGWSVPSETAWQSLEILIGVPSDELDEIGLRGTDQGTQLKALSNLWTASGIAGTDVWGFEGLPGGERVDEEYIHAGNYGFWWTATLNDEGDKAFFRELTFNHAEIYRHNGLLNNGMSIRCIKDSE